MFLNVFIIMFIIGIAYWQGLQGFFSAFIHLVLVIVSGALAFAFWEPLSMGLLAGMMPRFAWAVGLVIPFVFFLLLLRVAIDKLVPANVDFSQLTNLVAGGACGALAAALTAGIFVISISYLPGASDNFGYKPYTVDPASGRVVKSDGGGLVLGVDSLAANVFTTLSSGSFAPANGKSLATHQPDLIQTAHYLRLRSDPNSSTVATPGSVKVLNHYSHALPTDKLPAILIDNLSPDIAAMLKDDKQRLVAIETEWTNLNKNFDSDRLRVYPYQIALVTSEKGGTIKPVQHLPFAISRQTKKTPDEREFSVINKDGIEVATESTADTTLTFLFVVPANHDEQYLRVRGLRFPLTPIPALPEQPTEKVLAVLGSSLAKGAAGSTASNTNTGKVGDPVGTKVGVKPEDIAISAELPIMTSKNLAPDLTYSTRNEIMSGTGSASRPGGPISKANQVTQFYVPEQQAMIRIRLAKQIAHSYLSHAQAAAGALNQMFITDNEGNNWFISGYVWLQKSSNTMEIRFNTQDPVKAVALLPIKKMAEDDDLYIYFLVKKNIRLDQLKVGNIQSTDLNRLEVK